MDDDDLPDDELVVAPLEVRLPGATLLVVEADDAEAWVVVHLADDGTAEERPDRHREFADAVEYVAAVAQRAARDLPVVDPRDGLEALAVFDGVDGVLVVVKEATDRYVVSWVDDDGDVAELATYETVKEAILCPVLDDELFVEVED